MIRRTLALCALAALPALALDQPQWPPPEGVEARMRELQQVIMARDSTPVQRDAAREELVGLLKSPAGQQRDAPTDKRPARAAIEPHGTTLVPVTPLAPPPGSVAHIEVIQPPKALIVPQTGAAVQPSSGFAIDGRTGRILHPAGNGYVDPQTGRFTPR